MSSITDDRVHVVRNSGTYEGKQGLTYFQGISKENTGSKGVCLHVLTMQPGERANAHYHDGHESAIYVISGEAEQLWGDRLENHDVVRAGDYVYIPSGVPHVVMNIGRQPTTAVIARTDPNEQESVVLTPDLEEVVQAFLAARPPLP
jgi:uncharacterized RmlC-like cupin family protein